MTRKEGTPSEHPLFRAMVVMGGSLAVGCGGSTVLGESKSDPHTGSTGGAGDMADAPGGSRAIDVTDVPSAGGSTGTNTPGSGGKVSIGTGGSGGVVSGTGGVTGSGGIAGSGGTGPTEAQCPATQWSCGADQLRCGLDGNDSWELPVSCVCDPTRPSSAADCATGQIFTCRHAMNGLFECSCVPKTDDCSNACKTALPSPRADGFQCDTVLGPDGDAILCGCGFVYLR